VTKDFPFSLTGNLYIYIFSAGYKACYFHLFMIYWKTKWSKASSVCSTFRCHGWISL